MPIIEDSEYVNDNPNEAIIVITMVFEQEMKHSYKMVASDFGMPISTIYISKLAFQNKRPKTCILCIYPGQ